MLQLWLSLFSSIFVAYRISSLIQKSALLISNSHLIMADTLKNPCKSMGFIYVHNECILNLKCLLVSGLAGHMQDCAVLSASLFYCICLTIMKPCNVEV